MTSFRLFSRWVIAACAVLIALGWPLGALAYTFNLVSNASGQRLTWFWETCTSNCLTSVPLCGNITATNGEIPYSFYERFGNLCGGLLDWTVSSGSLTVAAVPTVAVYVPGMVPCEGRWAAVDAREIPLVFAIAPEPGDPFPLDVTLQIRPRLLGTIEQFTYPNTQADLWLQMISTVDVDGQVVSADSLMTFVHLFGGPDSLWQLSLPKGAANSVLVPGLTAGSEITLRIWAYMRAYVTNQLGPGNAWIYASSSYAQGPALEIMIRDLNAVDVSPQPNPAILSLSARPNPAPATARIQYTLPRPSQVQLSVFDLAGARVATLVDGFAMAGRNAQLWDGRNSRGGRLAPGVYVMELIAGDQRTTGRVVLLGH